jgi:glycosyltransferase involved in cell wall biosynthesis
VRILVVTVVHHPEDSRIRHRQINALLDAEWRVTYAAPFAGYGLNVASTDVRLRQLELPRAAGRRRVRAWRAARSLLKSEGPRHDLVLLHDPELLAAIPRRGLPPVVWDVHEDTAAAVTLKPWLPRPLRPIVKGLIQRAERSAERRVHLILAEHAYQDRFKHQHLVVPNVNVVPEVVPLPDQPRAVYVGSLTRARGAFDMIEVARMVAAKTHGEVKLLLIGPAPDDVATSLHDAAADGVLDWLGFVPSDHAMQHVKGSLAGLSLLRDEPNYRVSLPTKVVEYMAHGIPVITTPLPLARDLVAEIGCGITVPFDDPSAAAQAILDLWNNSERRHKMGAVGHAAARERYDWATHARDYTTQLNRLATSHRFAS